MQIKRGLYRHFKGNYYQVIDVANDSEDQQAMVVYRALYGDKGLWVRPLAMFSETIERDGKQQARFAYCDDQSLVTEVATLDISDGQDATFEQAFIEAQTIIASVPGYISHQIKRCVEQESRYILIVEWQTIEDHTIGFRASDAYQKWRALLHRFFDATPLVQHYRPLSGLKQ